MPSKTDEVSLPGHENKQFMKSMCQHAQHIPTIEIEMMSKLFAHCHKVTINEKQLQTCACFLLSFPDQINF